MNKTQKIAVNGLLTGIMILLGLTPIGYLKIGVIDITFMCLPVIIGTILMGLGSGIFLGFMFGATSLYQALVMPSALVAVLLDWPVPLVFNIFIPRLIIPIVTHFVYQGISKGGTKRDALSIAVASVAGSLTNTVLFLGMMVILFTQPLAGVFAVPESGVIGAVAGLAAMNGLPEAAAAGIICTPIIKALKKVWRKKK